MIAVVLATAFLADRELIFTPGLGFRVTPPREWKREEAPPELLRKYSAEGAVFTVAAMGIERKPNPFERAIDTVLTAVKKEVPGSEARQLDTLRNAFGHTAFVFSVRAPTGVESRFAFYQSPQRYVVFAARFETEAALVRERDRFEAWVLSYGFITDNVRG